MQSDFDPKTVKIIQNLDYLEPLLKGFEKEKIFILTDNNTKEYCLHLIKKYFQDLNYHLIEIPAGEANKSIEKAMFIWGNLLEEKATKNSLLINLGGGVITDLGGFIASTLKRGMKFINIPTSLMAQVDAAIGGKNGINFSSYKNQIGVINQPSEVIIFPGFLKTLDKENFLSGFAEIIKYGFISKLLNIDDLLSLNPNNEIADNIEHLIKASVAVKVQYVLDDPYEKNIRKALNFGHTFAHAFESVYAKNNKELLHGYAVAAGIICELYLSHLYTNYPLEKIEIVKKYVLNIYGKADVSLNDFDILLSAMQQDKKNINQSIIFTLVTINKEVKINITCSNEEILQALKYYLF